MHCEWISIRFSGGTCTRCVAMNGKSHHIIADPIMTQIVLLTAKIVIRETIANINDAVRIPNCLERKPRQAILHASSLTRSPDILLCDVLPPLASVCGATFVIQLLILRSLFL